MRKLNPTKAIAHALRSVLDFAPAGIRFSLWWVLILLALSIAIRMSAEPPKDWVDLAEVTPAELFLAAVGLAAFCSIAVNWHRYILQDDASGPPLRLDGLVWRYIGNSVLIALIAFVPVVLLVIVLAFLPQAASIFILPATLVAFTFATILSIKLPAIALGRTDFGLRNALNAAQGNFWQIMGMFLIYALIGLLLVFLAVLVTSAAMAVNSIAGTLIGLALELVVRVFQVLFSVSVLSSLYGFFVEKRDF